MLTIQDVQDFKIERRKIQLPKPENNKGNLIFLPYLSPEDCVKAIHLSGKLFNRLSYWKLFFRNYRYQFKLFNKNIRYVNLKERNEILDNIGRADSSIKPIKNFLLAKGKNCYIDLSYYLLNFFNFKRTQYKLILSQFFGMLKDVINSEDFKDFNEKSILIDINQWGINKISNIYQKNSILNNPVSLFYLGLRKFPELVKELGDINVIITDGTLFFKFNPSTIDKDAYMDFKLTLSKIRPNMLSSDLDNDSHLDTYGSISSKASSSELAKAKDENKEVTGDQQIDSTINDKDDNKSLLDKIHDLQGDNISDPEENEDEDEEDDSEDIDDSSEEEEKSSNTSKEPEKDDEEELEDEINTELSDEEAAQIPFHPWL